MRTQQQLYEKYIADVVELQSKCKHKKQSDWMQQEWAPGHSTGMEVRICEVCSVVVEKRLNEFWIVNNII